MAINVMRDQDGIIEQILINDEEIESDDGETSHVPKGLLKGIRFSEMPNDISFLICERIEEGIVILNTLPFRIFKISDEKAYVYFEDLGRRKYWDGDVGYKLYMETKRDVIIEREKEIDDIKIESYDDDGDYIICNYPGFRRD